MFSGVALGMMKVPGHGASLSIIRVIFTSPSCQEFMPWVLRWMAGTWPELSAKGARRQSPRVRRRARFR